MRLLTSRYTNRFVYRKQNRCTKYGWLTVVAASSRSKLSREVIVIFSRVQGQDRGMAKNQQPNRILKLLPVTAVSERRCMRLLLGILTLGTVLGWFLVISSAGSIEYLRFFRSHGNAPFHDCDFGRSNASDGSSHTEEPSIRTDAAEVMPMDLPSSPTAMRVFRCLGWRATGDCSPDGTRKPDADLNCNSLIP